MAEPKQQNDTPNPAPAVLDLSATDLERPSILVPGGQRYEMRHPDELSFDMMKKLNRAQSAITRVSDQLDKAESDEDSDRLIDEMASQIRAAVQICMVDFPDEAADSLPLGRLQRIPQFFFELLNSGSAAAETSAT